MAKGGKGGSWEDVKPTPATLAEARERKARIEQALHELESKTLSEVGILAVRSRAHVNRDHTVDGEFLVNVPRGYKADDLLGDLNEVLKPIPGVWHSTIMRFDFDDPEDTYRRFKGMPEVEIYSQRMSNDAKIAQQTTTARKVLKSVERRHKVKAKQILIRIRWDKHGRRPKR